MVFYSQDACKVSRALSCVCGICPVQAINQFNINLAAREPDSSRAARLLLTSL